MKKIFKISSIVFVLLFAGCGSEENKNQTKVENKTEINTKTEKTVEKTKATVVEKNETAEKKNGAVKVVKTGENLFFTCVACHGINADKSALNVSKIINTMSKDEIISALNGYKNGTYGGNMKGIMIGQVKNFSNDDIEKIAEYIKTKK